MERSTIALFGEAEKGEFQTAYYCQSLTDLEKHLGNPPADSKGLFFAIQAILYRYSLLFFRVKEEGFSALDYLQGVKLLETNPIPLSITAIGIPGVGNSQILKAVEPLCFTHHRILLISESDLYDYLTI